MKQLPIIQPRPESPLPTESSAQTDQLVSDPERTAALRPQIVQALSKVFDPEIPVNIYELGLIYDVIVTASGQVGVRMTLTAPACPAAQFLPSEVKRQVSSLPGVSDVVVDVVWDPPWDRDRMSDVARLQLGMF